jgi:uncharacterized delta-60 repeat protein
MTPVNQFVDRKHTFVEFIQNSADMSLSPRVVLVGLFFSSTFLLKAQPGAIDPGFDAGGAAYADLQVSSATVQPDGKILVVAYGTDQDGNSQPSKLMRLNSDGSIDPTFSTGATTYWARSMELRQDGHVFLGGFDKIKLFNSDGEADTSFSPDLGTVDNISGMALQPDGKLLVIAGNCPGSFGQWPNMRLARLLPDGSQDPDFNTPVRSTSGLSSVKALPDGRILVGGNIVYYDGSDFVFRGLCRLLPDGSIDPTFDVQPGTIEGPGSSYMGASVALTNGNVISGVTTLSVAMPDGTMDPAFAPVTVTGPWDPWVRAIVEQEDGKIIIAGRFTACNGISQGRIARLNSDGSLDGSFISSVGDDGFSTEVDRLLLQPDGKVLVGGYFTSMNGQAVKGFLRLNTCPTGVQCEDFTTNVQASITTDDAVRLFPVPYQDGPLNITSAHFRSSEAIFVSIQGADGKTVMNERSLMNRGDGSAMLELTPGMASGVYLLRVRTHGWESAQRFVKQ